MSNPTRPSLQKVIHWCRKHGIFSLKEGRGDNARWSFWHKDTGKLVVTWYERSGRWLSGDGKRDGTAKDFRTAVQRAKEPEHG